MPPKAKKGGGKGAAKSPTAKAAPVAAKSASKVKKAPAEAAPASDDEDNSDFDGVDTDDEEADIVILTPSDDEEGDEDDVSDDDSDVDSDGSEEISEAGVARLMEALGEDGLDEDDLAALAALRGEATEADSDENVSEGEEEEEDDEDDEEEEEEEEEDDAEEEADATSSSNKDTLAASLLRSGLVAQEEDDEDEDEDEDQDDEDVEDEADSSAVPLDSLTDAAFEALPDAVRSTRFHRERINNKEALTAVRDAIALDPPSAKGKNKMEWIEHMAVTWDKSVAEELEEQNADAEDDLKRELTIYKQALHGAVLGRQRVLTAGLPFSRPDDFFAEMVKSDSHMERIRQKLLDERSAIKASEEAKRQRELKKFGKKVQVEKQLERQKNKRDMEEKIQGLKRKRGTLDDAAGQADDDFDVKIESAIGGASQDGKRSRGGGDKDKARMPRSARDSKYGFGGKKKYSKSNTKESTEGGFGQYKGPPKRGGPSARGGGGGKGKRGGGSSRPGKSKRAGGGRR